MRITHTHSGYKRGTALFMSLIFLLIMTILGVFGMNISRMENLMAGNNQFQAQALNNSELALREIEGNYPRHHTRRQTRGSQF